MAHPVHVAPVPSDVDDTLIGVTDSSTQVSRSGDTSPAPDEEQEHSPSPAAQNKKKKKKKNKKSAKAKEDAAATAAAANNKAKAQDQSEPPGGRPPVLCISRNKHWRYISSYHGPWLQLPLELLESLLSLNLDPATLTAPDTRHYPSFPSPQTVAPNRLRDRGFHSLSDYSHSPPESPGGTFGAHHSLQQLPPPPPPFPNTRPGKATPPPIDPGVFRSVTNIRRLIDEAAELSVRAASGLSSSELASNRNGSILTGTPWATAQSLGLNPMGVNIGNGRNVAMSAMRIHRLRALAVQKLAQAYRTDEIASSVMVMQGGTVFDDVAERVLKHDPNDLDAKYVHFFHEKIPSRSQLAESTTTKVLDELIASNPQRLEYYRTRGIVHCFRDEYPQATKDFTHALKEARAARKLKTLHCNTKLITAPLPSASDYIPRTGTKPYKRRKNRNGRAPPDGTSSPSSDGDGAEGEPLPLHPSALPTAPDPIEPQLLFLRGAAFLQHAVYLIERAVLELEGVRKVPSVDGAELRLCYIENGRYGGVEIGNPDGPLGRREGEKVRVYRKVLAGDVGEDGDEGEREGGLGLRSVVEALLRKSIRDHERFLAHFDSIDSGTGPAVHRYEGEGDPDIVTKMEYAFLLSESIRPGHHHQHPNSNGNRGSTANGVPSVPPLSSRSSSFASNASSNDMPIPATFTTYHPLLVESHFSILICQLMLADFANIIPTFMRTALLLDGLEGYPVFLPPRSMGQAEFVEVLERLAGGWRHGSAVPMYLLGGASGPGRGKARLAMEAPPPPPAPLLLPVLPVERSRSGSPVVGGANGTDDRASSSSSISSSSSFAGFTSSSTSSSRKNSDTSLSSDAYTLEPGSSSTSSGRVTPTINAPAEDMKTPTAAGVNPTDAQHTSSNGHAPRYTYPLNPRGAKSLECARILLAPVIKRQKERAEKAAKEKVAAATAAGGKNVKQQQQQPAPINIPLHGPRVEVILAWLGAVHLPELEEY